MAGEALGEAVIGTGYSRVGRVLASADVESRRSIPREDTMRKTPGGSGQGQRKC